MTKPLVAATVLALAERKQINLDESICAAVAQCPPSWQPATLRDLLTFTSGIPDLFNNVAAVPPERLTYAVDATIRATPAEQSRVTSTAGTDTAYSNFDYLLLGYAIQSATHQSWLAVMSNLIFGPAQMTSTRYDDAFELLAGRARGYKIVGGTIENTKYEDDGGLSAGGLLSTVGDMYRFIRAYQGDRFFSGATRTRALTPDSAGFGYGWQITSFFGRSVQDFTGGTNGFSSNMSYYPQDDATVVVLSNLENEGAKGVSCDVGAIMHGATPRNEQLLFVPVLAADPAIGGSFATKDGKVRTFAVGASGLTYRGPGSSTPQSVLSNGPRSYALAEHPDVVFDLSDDGRTLRVTSCGTPLFDAVRT